MFSLSQILSDHAPLLLIDASSERIQVGLFEGAVSSALWADSSEEAGVGIFECVDKLTGDLAAIRAFVFCEGPGSILGIRTSAMALRTWGVLEARPFFAYRSLALVAQAIGRTDVAVIADARRGLWHRCAAGGPLTRVPTADLTGNLVMPEGFRHWTALPNGIGRVPYVLADLLATVDGAALFRPVEAPDAFLHEEPRYAPWTPEPHRIP